MADPDTVARARAKLGQMTPQAPAQADPSGDSGGGATGWLEENVLGPVVQGGILGPAEELGNMAQRYLPGRLGETAREMANDPQPKWLSDYLAQHRRMGEEHPITATAGNLATMLAAGGPRAGAGAVERVGTNVGMGVFGGATQPLDPNDPNYDRDKGIQTGLGGVISGTLGEVANAAANRAAQASRAGLNLIRSAYDRMGLGQYAPTELTRETARQVAETVGQRLGQIYQHMTFNPNMPGWLPGFLRHLDDVATRLPDPAMRQRWLTMMRDKVFRPLFQSDPRSTRAPRITGDSLHKIMSKLSGDANILNREARNSPNAMMVKEMERGLRAIHQNIGGHIDRAFPAVAPDRQAANEAYQIADWFDRAAGSANRWRPTPGQIATAGERKFGKRDYEGPRFQPQKQMLERERDLADAAKAKEAGPAAQFARRMVSVPFTVGGYKLGQLIHQPWAGAVTGSTLGAALDPQLAAVARTLGRYPGMAGAVGGQAGRAQESIEDYLP